MIDFDKYTLGELAKIEELTGLSIPALMQSGAPQMKRAAALVFVEKKRRGDTVTWTQVLNWTMPQVNEFLAEAGNEDTDDEGDESPDPKETSAKGKRTTSRSSSSRSDSNRASTGD